MFSDNPSAELEPAINPKHILSAQQLNDLNQKSNLQGWLHLTGHLAIMGGSGVLWGTQMTHLWIALPALVIYGFSFAAMFAPLHECGHRTAFASDRTNRIVEWVAGCLSFYNSAFYRRYHKWHHRYTLLPGKDPELTDLAPTRWYEYLLILSGIPWWIGKVSTHLTNALGQTPDHPFLSEETKADVIHSTRLQLLTYGGIFASSAALGHPEFILLYWLLPLAVGQPILRFILLAEHTGCQDPHNPLSNTRTTLTLFPLRFMMWNMSFHAEHHLYPSLPFHALANAHSLLKAYFSHVDAGYLRVNQRIVSQFGPAKVAQPTP
jgi:fatty acid desaturase